MNQELSSQYVFGNLVGKSAAIKNLIELISIVSPVDSAVIITGETGTGKDMVSQLIHSKSMRKDQKFIKINCSTLSETLLESELFGYEKGSFSGSSETKIGFFEFADGGTIFLDEIGELPLNFQPSLLQVIEHGVFRRVGSVDETKVDVRIIAATNRDLQAEVKKGTFRADLYHRLNVITLNIPPLRERKEDIPLLVNHFITTAEKDPNKRPYISAETMSALVKYHWPGNVRELKNLVERTIVLCDNQEIKTTDLPESISIRPLIPPPKVEYSANNVLNLIQVEQQYIAQVLKVAKNKTHAAELLGISLPTLRKKIRELHADN